MIHSPHQPSPGLAGRLRSLLRQRDGELTRRLLLTPGGGGLGHLPAQRKPDATTQMICGYCSTGCSLDLHLREGEAVGLTPTVDYPVNSGMACPKGWEALTVLRSPQRATTPLLRRSQGNLAPVDWDTALRTFCGRFQAIQAKYGNESIAFLSSGQIATEEMAFLGSLFKFGMQGLHADGNTRQCMASAVIAYQQAFGFDAPPYCYQDLEESDVIVLIGTNLCIAHPILWQRVLGNPHRPQIVVIDPRTTETACFATQHLAVRPQSDPDLFYGLARLLMERNWIDHDYIAAHTRNFEDFAAFVRSFTPDVVTARTGIPAEQLQKLARTIHEGKRVSFWWTMGVNQSHQGVRTAQAIINLALMTGNIGRPGTGANSITGQCNAMGSRLFSNTTNLLGGHDFENAHHRRKVAKILGIDQQRIPSQKGWAYPRIVEGILRGTIRGLWIIATNPAHSWINQNQFLDVLDRLDFLVVQDMYATTETARRADLLLPAAGWGEKEGTFINSERRIGLLSKVAKPPGEALTDFAVFRLIAEYWGCGGMFRDWESPAAVFQILKSLSRGQPCDISGIRDYAMLAEEGGIQWPFPLSGPTNEERPHCSVKSQRTGRRLFEDGRFYHADGRARFLFEEPKPLPEPPNRNFPLILLTGRGSAAQWHTQTRTNNSAVLRKLSPGDLYVEINPADADDRGIRPHEWVRVESQRGRVRARALVTPTVPPGSLFLPMHYPAANQLTDSVFDPYSSQPAYKACAVQLRRETFNA